ncbi:RNA-binding protein CP29B- chloroplastic, partial [Striga hermonthica]
KCMDGCWCWSGAFGRKRYQQIKSVMKYVQVIYDNASGRNRVFCFMTMSMVEEVEDATHKFNGY